MGKKVLLTFESFPPGTKWETFSAGTYTHGLSIIKLIRELRRAGTFGHQTPSLYHAKEFIDDLKFGKTLSFPVNSDHIKDLLEAGFRIKGYSVHGSYDAKNMETICIDKSLTAKVVKILQQRET